MRFQPEALSIQLATAQIAAAAASCTAARPTAKSLPLTRPEGSPPGPAADGSGGVWLTARVGGGGGGANVKDQKMAFEPKRDLQVQQKMVFEPKRDLQVQPPSTKMYRDSAHIYLELRMRV